MHLSWNLLVGGVSAQPGYLHLASVTAAGSLKGRACSLCRQLRRLVAGTVDVLL